MEKFDGFKHIDIAIPEAKVNIEVDGGHHNISTNRHWLSKVKQNIPTFVTLLKGSLQ